MIRETLPRSGEARSSAQGERLDQHGPLQPTVAQTPHLVADADRSAEHHDQAPELRETIADCDAKIARYRATLDAGGDPSTRRRLDQRDNHD